MRRFRDLPIRQKLIWIVLIASGVALMAAAAAVLTYEATTFRPKVVNDLEAQAELISSNLEAAVSFNDSGAATEDLAALSARADISAACVYRTDGSILARYERPDVTDFSFPARPGEPGYRFAPRHLILVRAFEVDGELLGHLFLCRDLPTLPARLPQYGIMVGVVLLALFTVASMLAVTLKRVISGPLLDLADAAERVQEEEDYTLRVTRNSDDEIGQLTGAFHRMLAAIEQREADLRKVNAELAQSERFNQQISDSMPSLLYVLDLRTELLTHVNRQVEKSLGYSPERLLEMGSEAFEMFAAAEPDPRSREEVRREEASDGDIIESELRIRHANGEQRWLRTRETVFRRSADGEPSQILGVAQDITEQKLLREQLLQAQKMESIGRLAGGVAHDFNNLLTVIVGSAELARLQLREDSPLQRYIKNIREATRQAADLTRQLLAFARKQIIEPRVLDLNRLVLDAEKMLHSLIGDDIELVTVPHPGLWLIRVDPGQMMQVLINLVVNARDAMPEGGELRIETRNVMLDKEVLRGHPAPISGEFVRLAVRDSGIGMSPESTEHLFEPFYTTKEVGEGTGLGLATCYGIIQQSGGHISVESRLGRGTTFYIFMRRSQAEVQVEEPASPELELPTGRETLIMVEDNALVRSTTVRLLREQGYHVLEAACGPDALALLDGRLDEVDLVITDVVMPQMNGKELADRLRRRRPEIKILFVSGYARNMADGRGGELESGVHFLQKPYTSESLIRRVRAILDE